MQHVATTDAATSAPPDDRGRPALQITGLRKAFGETQALVSCSLTCAAGTVHAILGENGSGKSTLVKIVSGIIPPDGGEIRAGGTRVERFTVETARRLGIVTVFQEVLVAPNRSVLDNVWLGYDRLFRRRIATGERRAVARRTLARLSATAIDLDALVEAIPLPQRQLVVIARALVRKPRILILDEATAALDVGDRQSLYAEIDRLTAGRCTVIYISHRMDEIMQLAAAVTVLRSGESVLSAARAEVDVQTLLRAMSPTARLEHVDV